MTARRTRCAYFALILVDGFEDIVNRREFEPLSLSQFYFSQDNFNGNMAVVFRQESKVMDAL